MSQTACWTGTWRVKSKCRKHSGARAGGREGSPASAQRWFRRGRQLSKKIAWGKEALLKEPLPFLLYWPCRVASHSKLRVSGGRCQRRSQLRICVVKAEHVAQMCPIHTSLCGSAWKAFSFLSLLPLPGYLFHKSPPSLRACMDPQASIFKPLQLPLFLPLALGIFE